MKSMNEVLVDGKKAGDISFKADPESQFLLNVSSA